MQVLVEQAIETESLRHNSTYSWALKLTMQKLGLNFGKATDPVEKKTSPVRQEASDFRTYNFWFDYLIMEINYGYC